MRESRSGLEGIGVRVTQNSMPRGRVNPEEVQRRLKAGLIGPVPALRVAYVLFCAKSGNITHKCWLTALASL